MNKLNASFGLKGHFNIKKFSRNGILLGEWDFDNLITNNGMNLIPTSANLDSYCALGTGSTIPAFTDTSLDVYYTYVSVFETSHLITKTTPYDLNFVAKYAFNIGTFDNTNITELGCGPEAEGINLFTHQQILDDLGNPTTITVLSDESLLVTWTLTCSINANTQNYNISIDIDGVPTNFAVTQNPLNVWANCGISVLPDNVTDNSSRGYVSNDWLELFECVESIFNVALGPYAFETDAVFDPTAQVPQSDSSRINRDIMVRDPYVNDSWELTGSGTWGPLSANFATGVGRVYFFTSYGDCQFSFSPKIPKVEGKSLTLNFKTTWDRL